VLPDSLRLFEGLKGICFRLDRRRSVRERSVLCTPWGSAFRGGADRQAANELPVCLHRFMRVSNLMRHARFRAASVWPERSMRPQQRHQKRSAACWKTPVPSVRVTVPSPLLPITFRVLARASQSPRQSLDTHCRVVTSTASAASPAENFRSRSVSRSITSSKTSAA